MSLLLVSGRGPLETSSWAVFVSSRAMSIYLRRRPFFASTLSLRLRRREVPGVAQPTYLARTARPAPPDVGGVFFLRYRLHKRLVFAFAMGARGRAPDLSGQDSARRTGERIRRSGTGRGYPARTYP